MDTPRTEYRHLPADNERFHQYVRYAFRPTAGPWDEDAREDLRERVEDDELVARENRGLFPAGEADADPVAVAGWHEFETRVRGAFHPLGAVTAVATPPEHRRRGHVRDLLTEMLVEFREADLPLSVLWPFKRSFYRALGWETCSLYDEVETPPEQLRGAGAAPAGEFVPSGPDDWETLAPVLAAHEADRALHVDRTAEWWEKRVFQWWGGEDSFGYRWDDDGGEARAYLVYRFADGDGDDGRTLRVLESAWTDHEAYRHLLRFLGDHDSQVETVEWYCPPDPDARLLDLVEDPSAVTVRTKAGPMVRVVDVVDALSTLDYPTDGTVTVGVTDPVLPANDGTFRLTVEGGEPRCEPTEADPVVTLPMRALSQLVVGFRDATFLAETGAIAAAPTDPAVASLDALFPAEPTLLREGF
jgi:predicted acetyltransferase